MQLQLTVSQTRTMSHAKLLIISICQDFDSRLLQKAGQVRHHNIAITCMMHIV